MSEVPSRELRNDTRRILDRAAAGEHVTITVGGRAVARVVPLERRPRWLGREALFERLATSQADPSLAAELEALLGDTTDDLDPM
jgi:prevent-host-death family protein